MEGLCRRYVYDGVLEAQMSMLFDTNKRLLKVNDIYPEAVQLSKGDYIIRLYLRHDDSTLLAKMRNLPIIVDRKLGDAITVPIYNTQAEAVKASNGTAKERTLYPGAHALPRPLPNPKPDCQCVALMVSSGSASERLLRPALHLAHALCPPASPLDAH